MTAAGCLSVNVSILPGLRLVDSSPDTNLSLYLTSVSGQVFAVANEGPRRPGFPYLQRPDHGTPEDGHPAGNSQPL